MACLRLVVRLMQVSSHVVLQPFVAPFVPKYHDWMEDEWIREMTASERLTLAEDHQMQADWVDDNQKATFIVFDKGEMIDAGTLPMDALDSRGGALSLTGDVRGMIGDVNIFLLSEDEAQEYGDAARRLHCAGDGADSGTVTPATTAGEEEGSDVFKGSPLPRVAEIMIMVAEPCARRRGVAQEAARVMMEWGRRNLGIGAYVAKISDSNAASIALFTSKLGFAEAKRVAVFEEVHLVSRPVIVDVEEDRAKKAVGTHCTHSFLNGLFYAEQTVSHAY